MAIDFPASPSPGQIYTAPNGVTYTYNGTVWTATGSSGLITGAPNKLINPFLEIDQANEGATLTNTGSVAAYAVDGVKYSSSAGVGTITTVRSSNAPNGYPNSVQMTVTGTAPVVAGTAASFQLPVEANDLVDTAFGTSSAQSLSLSIWLRTNPAGVFSVSLRNAATNRSYVFTVNVSSALIWQNFTQIVPGDTTGTWIEGTNAIGMYLDITPVGGSTYQTSALNSWQAGNFLAASSATNNFSNSSGATFQLGSCLPARSSGRMF